MQLLRNIASYTLLLAMVTLLGGKSVHIFVHPHSCDTVAYQEDNSCQEGSAASYSHSHTDSQGDAQRESHSTCSVCNYHFSAFVEAGQLTLGCSVVQLDSSSNYCLLSDYDVVVSFSKSRAPPVSIS
ncbi:MAG: hypothetical protein R3Y61_05825 [Rikenellaceae bacterium]